MGRQFRLADEHWRLMDGKEQDFLIVSDRGRVEVARGATEYCAVYTLWIQGRWELGERIVAATELSDRR